MCYHTLNAKFKYLMISVFGIILSTNIFSQENQPSKKLILFSGIVYDSNKINSPLAQVSVCRKNKIGTSSNDEGKFSIYVSVKDTLTFSHIGFRSSTIYISELIDNERLVNKLYLVRDTFNLMQIIVTPFQNYKDFKSYFLNMKTEYDYELVNAQNNINLSIYAAKYIQPKLEAEDYQDASIQKETNHLVYRGQLSPEQMIDFFKITDGFINMISKTKKETDTDKDN